MTLEVRKLVGGYSQVPVLKDVNFNVRNGEVVGLIGLNGAGKSTTINHIIGLLKPFSGTISINSITLEKDVDGYKKQIAYIPESPIVYQELTLKEHIELTIMAYGLDHTAAWQKADQLLKTFRLSNKLDWFPDNFSKGMRQKVMIVCAFITDADLFVIDEPFIGLDPVAVSDLLKLIEDKKHENKSILMTTHVLDTAEKFCDRFVLLNEGTVRVEGTLSELRAAFPETGESLNDIYLSLAKGGE